MFRAYKDCCGELPTFHDRQDVGDGLDHIYYAPVTSEGLEKRLGIKLKPHPDKVSEAAALSSVRSPDLKYSLCLPKEILLSKCQLQIQHSLASPLALRILPILPATSARCAVTNQSHSQILGDAEAEHCGVYTQMESQHCRYKPSTWPVRDMRPICPLAREQASTWEMAQEWARDARLPPLSLRTSCGRGVTSGCATPCLSEPQLGNNNYALVGLDACIA